MGASGLNDDDDGKNDGLKWKLAESFLPLFRYRHFQKIQETPLPQLSSFIHRLEGCPTVLGGGLGSGGRVTTPPTPSNTAVERFFQSQEFFC